MMLKSCLTYDFFASLMVKPVKLNFQFFILMKFKVVFNHTFELLTFTPTMIASELHTGLVLHCPQFAISCILRELYIVAIIKAVK